MRRYGPLDRRIKPSRELGAVGEITSSGRQSYMPTVGTTDPQSRRFAARRKMGRPSQSPIWPFLLVVAFLFLLCIIAPREWEHIARENPARPLGGRVLARTSLASPGTQSAIPMEPADVCMIDEAAEQTAGPLAVSATEREDEYCHPSDAPAIIAEATSSDQREERAARIDDDPPRSSTAATRDIQGEPQPPTAEPKERHPVVAEQDAAASVEPAAIAPRKSPVSGPRWPEPLDLLRRLENLSCECECSEWALHAAQLVVELCENTTPIDERARTILSQLRRATEAVDPLVPSISERSVAIELLRVRHALVRRLDVWELAPALFDPSSAKGASTQATVNRLLAALDRLDAITGHAGAEGRQWRQYLALDALRYLTRPDSHISAADARKLAREVLERISRKDLTEQQRQFMASLAVADLADAVRPWAVAPFEPARLLVDIERFEVTNQPSDAKRVADDYQQSTALPANQDSLAQRLETNYRNANLRLAISEKLLQRLLPGPSTTTDPVRDRILGHPTRGVSTTSTTVGVKLVPDDHRLRVAIEASGQVFANTRSTSGPATLYSRSDSMYFARKVVDLDLRGIRTEPAESECIDSRTRLRSVSTDFDGVPLVGALVETVARSRHAEKEDEVRSILRRKVETQARQKMDALTEERLANVNRLLDERVMRPLSRMRLDPQMISAETSEQRLTMRLRLAGDEQLAGHTPRPRAPGDSLLSLQIHQSAFNNVCEQLKLEGRTFTLPELRTHIISTLNLQDSPFLDATDDDVSITFADADAIRVRCEDGRIELNLKVARLANNEHTWKDFQVRVYYQPEVDGLQARLVRDGIVQLVPGRTSARFQIALRGIFSKAFAKDRALMLVDPKWSTDERTRDLFFSQFVIQDGWIAAAVSEPWQNVARRPRLPTR